MSATAAAPQPGAAPAGAAAPAAPSKADTFVVSCIDPRVIDESTFFLSALGRTDRYSEMRIAGAALAAVDERTPAWSTALFENLAASRALHGIRKVTFINHRDCGAVRLWAGRNLSDNPAEEERVHADILNRAAAAVRARHPDLLIEIMLMDLDGSARILPCPVCVPQGFRAEAVGPAARSIAAAMQGPGARVGAPELPGAETAADPRGFSELVRVRQSGGPLTPEQELALLTEGVSRYGLSAAEARAGFAAEATRTGQTPRSAAEAEVVTFLRTRADRRGRVSRGDVTQAGDLYRRLTGSGLTASESMRRVAVLMDSEGLGPQPYGLFRSTAWFRALRQPVA